jgi:salicylate hydroxylase
MSSVPEVVILGGGICGLAAALALTKYVSPSPNISIFELRSEPATIGGAINLTPNALRYLDYLGVVEIIKQRDFGANVDKIELFSIRTGARLGELDFTNASEEGKGFGTPPYKGLRIMRAELIRGLLQAVAKLENIELKYGKKAVELREASEVATVTFEDGSEMSGNLILGCDGIHSAARRFVDPDRTPVYSGIAVAYTFAKIREGLEVPQDTLLCSSQQGSFMVSHYQPSRKNLYLGAVMEVAEVSSKEGWRAKGADQDAVRRDIKRRLGGGAMSVVDALIEDAGDWFLYPVYRLPPKGRWAKDNVMLLGDAAHAVSVSHVYTEIQTSRPRHARSSLVRR